MVLHPSVNTRAMCVTVLQTQSKGSRTVSSFQILIQENKSIHPRLRTEVQFLKCFSVLGKEKKIYKINVKKYKI